MKKILIIEDVPEIRDNLAEAVEIEFSSLEIHQAFDGRSGLAAAKSLIPDLIISDIKMPGLDGFEVLERIRADASTANIPFVFITAAKDRINLEKIKVVSDQLQGVLIKPFCLDDLISLINRLLQL